MQTGCAYSKYTFRLKLLDLISILGLLTASDLCPKSFQKLVGRGLIACDGQIVCYPVAENPFCENNVHGARPTNQHLLSVGVDESYRQNAATFVRSLSCP